jgi:hypothetical protein
MSSLVVRQGEVNKETAVTSFPRKRDFSSVLAAFACLQAVMPVLRLNQTTEDSYTLSPTVGHFPARPEPFAPIEFCTSTSAHPERSGAKARDAQDRLRGAKSKDAASGPVHASTSPCGRSLP